MLAREGFDEFGPLLPSNRELETPDHDTALVRLLAQETLWISTRQGDSCRHYRRHSGGRAEAARVETARLETHRVEIHRSGSSIQQPERLTVPGPGSPLR